MSIGHLPYIVPPTQTMQIRHVHEVGKAGGAQRRRGGWAVLAEGTQLWNPSEQGVALSSLHCVTLDHCLLLTVRSA